MRAYCQVGLLILLSIPVAGQRSTGATSFAVQYNARLQISSRQQLDKRLRAPFPEGTAHPAGASNCFQLLAQRSHSQQQQKSDRDIQAERSTLAECIVLDQLWRAKPARSSYLTDLVWDEHVLP